MRALLASALLLTGCRSLAPPAEPVVLETSLEAGTYAAGAEQGVGATLVNRSREPIVHYGRAELRTVRLLRDSGRPYRRADAPADSARAVGPYWERAYHLAFAPEPGAVTTLELPLTVLEGGNRLVLEGARFAWPRDPGAYTVSVCSGYAPGHDEQTTREVCAPPVRVVLE